MTLKEFYGIRLVRTNGRTLCLAFFVIGGYVAEAKLNDKHLKALALIEQNRMTNTEIAKVCGFSVDYFHDLYEGNVEKCGKVADLFRSHVESISQKQHKQIKPLTRKNKLIALELLNDKLNKLKKNPKGSNTRELTMILNSLSKATPDVEIETFNQFNSMSPEEMANEFRRLKSLASEAIRGRVHGSSGSGTSEVPEAVRLRAGINKKPEA